MHTNRILMVLTSADRMGNEPTATGTWLEELAGPYYVFVDAKCDVTLASPKGGAAPVDETSLEDEHTTASTRRFQADLKAQKVMAHTIPLTDIDTAQYDAVFFPGGHGTMVDFPIDAQVKRVVEEMYQGDKTVAAVCHGPACLVQAVNSNAEPIVKGRRFTCFTDEEELSIGFATAVPFLLETKLSALGGVASTALPFVANVVNDGLLITGQNPASAIPAAEAVIHTLRHRQAVRHAA